MLKLPSVIILLLIFDISHGQEGPHELNDPKWANQLMAINLINLTIIICKDSMYKLRMADRIQQTYKHNFAYELGLLTSSILDKFKYMLVIYRHYSYMYDFKMTKHYLFEILNAYHVMQSTYNEIRAERDLFLDVVDQHEKRQQRKDPHAELIKKYKMAKAQYGRRWVQGYNGRRSLDVTPNDTIRIKNNTKMQRKGIKIMEKKKGNKTEWTRNHDVAETEYKKKLRYIKWADKWQGFNPEIEGVEIPDQIANIGLANASNFLAKDIKGAI